MGIKECCSSFVAGLPDPSLPILPSLLLGTSFAALFLLTIYKRQTNKPYKEVVLEVLKMLMFSLPTNENSNHVVSSGCQNPNCVRCKNYKKVSEQFITRFEEMKSKNITVSSRLEEAILTIKEKICSEKYRPLKLHPVADEPTPKLKKGKPSFQNPTILYMDLAANAYWNDFHVYTQETELLKLNFKVILEEFQEVFGSFQNGYSNGWKSNDIQNGHWCIYPFIDQGVVIEENCQRCPNTSTMLGSLPSVMRDCIFGNACFSILYPDSQIEPHHGPTNLRLRCHLGLSVPDGCFLEVAGRQHKWEAQKTIIFDDSFEHSATFVDNHSSLHSIPRAILMIDFWHPDISVHEKKVLLELLAP